MRIDIFVDLFPEMYFDEFIKINSVFYVVLKERFNKYQNITLLGITRNKMI